MELKDYMRLPYTKIIQEIHDGNNHYFYGRILELDGCQSTGATLDELDKNLKEAMEGYLEIKIEQSLPIPQPNTDDSYSGKFVIRLPKSLHRKLAISAENEGVSLNQYALYKLSQ